MDPRPYNYQYRRPRLLNPTYKSDYLHQSVYYPGVFQRVQPNKDKVQNKLDRLNNSITNQNSERQLKIYEQMKKIDPHIEQLWTQQQPSQSLPKISKNIDKIVPDNRNLSKYVRSQKQLQQIPPQNQYLDRKRQYSQQIIRSPSRNEQKLNMSNYGSKLLIPTVPINRINQDLVYQKQQKPYDIINCGPKIISQTHRLYPKYTLEHKLIESGLYPAYTYNPQR